jgi:ribosomal protein L14
LKAITCPYPSRSSAAAATTAEATQTILFEEEKKKRRNSGHQLGFNGTSYLSINNDGSNIGSSNSKPMTLPNWLPLGAP